MSFEFFSASVLGVLHAEPVVARRHGASPVGAVPSLAQRAELLEQLPEAVKDIDFGRRVAAGDAYDVPGVMVAVAVGRKVRRVVDHPHLEGHAAAAIDVPDGHRVVAGGHALEDVALLEGAVVQLVLVGALARGHHLDHMVARKGPVEQVGPIGQRRRGHGHRGTGRAVAARGQLGDGHRIGPALQRDDGWAGLPDDDHPVQVPLEGVQRRVEPRIDHRRRGTALLLGDRVPVLVHAEAVPTAKDHVRQLLHLQHHLRHGIALGLKDVHLVGHAHIDALRVDDVHVRKADRPGARLGTLEGLVKTEAEVRRVLAREYPRAQVGDLLVGHVLKVELRKAVARRKVVADNEGLRRGHRYGARLHDELEALHTAYVAARLGVHDARIDGLRVYRVVVGVPVAVRRGVHDGIGIVLRIERRQVKAHLERRGRLAPQDLGDLGGQVKDAHLPAIRRTVNVGRYLRAVVRNGLHDKLKLHDLKAARGGAGGPHIDGLGVAGILVHGGLQGGDLVGLANGIRIALIVAQGPAVPVEYLGAAPGKVEKLHPVIGARRHDHVVVAQHDGVRRHGPWVADHPKGQGGKGDAATVAVLHPHIEHLWVDRGPVRVHVHVGGIGVDTVGIVARVLLGKEIAHPLGQHPVGYLGVLLGKVKGGDPIVLLAQVIALLQGGGIGYRKAAVHDKVKLAHRKAFRQVTVQAHPDGLWVRGVGVGLRRYDKVYARDGIGLAQVVGNGNVRLRRVAQYQVLLYRKVELRKTGIVTGDKVRKVLGHHRGGLHDQLQLHDGIAASPGRRTAIGRAHVQGLGKGNDVLVGTGQRKIARIGIQQVLVVGNGQCRVTATYLGALALQVKGGKPVVVNVTSYQRGRLHRLRVRVDDDKEAKKPTAGVLPHHGHEDLL